MSEQVVASSELSLVNTISRKDSSFYPIIAIPINEFLQVGRVLPRRSSGRRAQGGLSLTKPSYKHAKGYVSGRNSEDKSDRGKIGDKG